MPRIEYRTINFRPATLTVIEQANQIAASYARQGLSLTLRQLYYRFVAQDLIPNKQTEYKRLGSIINDARYAGLFDWSLITDRTRNVQGGDGGYTPGHPEEVISPSYYSVTQWEGQPNRVEVWVEKDALIDVISQATSALRVPRFSCRGYTSSSEIWAAAQRIEGYLEDEEVEKVTVFHLGDHDPSGIDMTRDIGDRVLEFIAGDGARHYDVEINRIALNMDQILQYNPPPNPAKETDSRFLRYEQEHGSESWELDALEPRTLIDLIQGYIRPLIDVEKWDERRRITAEGQATLRVVRDNYTDVIEFLTERGLMPEIELDDADKIAAYDPEYEDNDDE
jgi:hypothetical protein